MAFGFGAWHGLGHLTFPVDKVTTKDADNPGEMWF